MVTNMLREKKPLHDLFPHKTIVNVDLIRQNLSNSLITLYDHLDIVNISINSQFVRTVMAENVSYVNFFFFCIFVFVNL